MPGAEDTLDKSWRKKLTDELPAKSVDAIERSVIDGEDVHRAATTAIAHLKGIGVLAGDTQAASVNVFIASAGSLPVDLADGYVTLESD